MSLVETGLKATEIGLGLLFPQAGSLIQLGKFAGDELTKLIKKGSDNKSKQLLKCYLTTFHETIEELWRTEENPLKDKWGFEQLEINPKNFAKKYDIYDSSNRSFIYDSLNETVAGMVRKEAGCESGALEFVKTIAAKWKDALERALWDANEGPLSKQPVDYRQRIEHEFHWAHYKLNLRLLSYEQLSLGKVNDGIQSIYVGPLAAIRERDKLYIPTKRQDSFDLGENIKKIIDHEKISQPTLVMGLPGMGKTSFAKMFVSKLAKDVPDVYPVFVRLRVLKARMGSILWTQAFYEAPHIENQSELLTLTEEDFSKKKILMILDGLDELALGGTDEAALNDFFAAVKQMKDWKQLHFIITSRPLQFLHSRERFKFIDNVFDIHPLNEERRDKLILLLKKAKVLKGETAQFKNWVAKIDKNNTSEEKMMGQPLLIFMMASIFSDIEDRSSLTINGSLGKVYNAIITTTLKRTYDSGGEEYEHYKKAGLETVEKARMFFGEVALALYQMGRDYALPDEIGEFLKKTEYKNITGNLKFAFIAFHMVENNKNGVEFFHKSLAEFLAAENIIYKLETMARVYKINSKIEDFAKNFIEIFGPQFIILAKYIRDILRNKEDFCDDLCKPLQVFVDGILNEHWIKNNLTFIVSESHPAHVIQKIDKSDPLGYEAKSGDAAIYLLSIIQEVREYNPPITLKLTDDNESSCSKFLYFLNRGKKDLQNTLIIFSPTIADFSGANLMRADLTGFDLSNALFIDANLAYASLVEANLNSTNFKNTNLFNVNFYQAFLGGTIFDGANLKGSSFKYTKGITAEQLQNAYSLVDCELEEEIKEEIIQNGYGHLFEKDRTEEYLIEFIGKSQPIK